MAIAAAKPGILSPVANPQRELMPMILDVDTGVDDALALLLSLRSPDVKVLGVTCVAGNASVDAVVENTLRVCDAAGAPEDLPIARGFGEPLVEPCHFCPQIHGKDGIGDLQPPLPTSKRQIRSEHAVNFLLDALHAAPSPVTVVALGPLTNIAVSFRMNAALWREKVARIVFMGGAVAAGGNMSAWAEANIGYDPEAAHVVLESGLPLLMYPLDVFLRVSYSAAELHALGVEDLDAGKGARESESQEPRSSWSLLAGRLLYREMRHFEEPSGCLGDAGAVAAALLPGAVTVKRLHVSVECKGERTRGMTVCDLRDAVIPPDIPKQPPNVDVIMDVNTSSIKSIFSRWVLCHSPETSAEAPGSSKEGGEPSARNEHRSLKRPAPG